MAALDQMEFLMHQPEVPSGPVSGPGFHGLPQHHGQGCPYEYLRSQQQQQQQQQPQQHQGHGSNLPPSHHFGSGSQPMPPHQQQLPHVSQLAHLPHDWPSGSIYHGASAVGNHSQQQQQQQQTNPHTQQPQHQPQHPPHSQSQTHTQTSRSPQSQPQPQPPPPPSQQPLPPLQHPTLLPQPYFHSHSHSHSHPHSHPYSHSHSSSPYDPVHSASAAWFSGSSQVGAWPAPAPHSHSQTRPAGSDLPFVGGSGGGGAGFVQPLVTPNQQFSPHHDHFSPFTFQGHHRPPARPRTSIVLPRPPQLSNQATRHGQPDENLPNPPSQAASSLSPPVPMSADRGAPPPGGRGAFTLPSLNPNSAQNQTPQHQPAASSQSTAQAASSSREPSPPASRPAMFGFPSESARSSNRPPADGPSATPARSRHDFAELFAREASSAWNGDPLAHPPPAAGFSGSSQRRHLNLRRMPQPDHDSDEDLGSSADEEELMLRYIDQFGLDPAELRALGPDASIRAAQLLRGQLNTRRVASRRVIDQLQSVDPDSLPENERTCVICYNDFGKASPEGVIEAPLRLPKCKHVFGDHCIKKWLLESDMCPYCRDKLPSEAAVSYPSHSQAFRNMMRMRTRIPPNTALTTADTFMRIVGQYDREAARTRDRQEAASDSTPPRPSHHRERRSPPSEAEGRRRTRARHSSFHPGHPTGGFASTLASRASTGAPPPRQHSPGRERSLPSAEALLYSPQLDLGAYPQQPISTSTSSASAGFRLPNYAPGQALPPAYYHDLSFGTAPGAPFSHRLPALTSLPPPTFPGTANGSNAGTNNTGGAQGQMQ